MVTQSQIADGFVLFAEKELLPALSGWQMWTAGAALVLLYQRAETILAELASNKTVTMLGLIDENGMVDIDMALEAAKDSVEKNGKLELDLPLFGEFKFDKKDFEKLAQYIKSSEA